MTSFQISLRPATPDDAPALSRFIDMASEGLTAHLWAKMADPDESLWDVGERRARRREGGFSYLNGHIAEIDGTAAGGLVGYPLPDEPVVIGPDFPAMFVPLQELEDLAPGSWYINALAVLPGFRNGRIGGHLLGAAERFARDRDCKQTSLIVFDRNIGARRLYECHGYREVARRPIIKDGWVCDSTESLLLVKDLTA
ncbi:MAG: GNAT family N-acetyltransferase [Alphaproteobacteria bacterium]|nr:GNAT family N-acetyltransferase [Alphaproteobacteria bacterium]